MLLHLSSHAIIFLYTMFSGIVVTRTYALDCGTERYSAIVTNQLSRCRHGGAESNGLVINFPIWLNSLVDLQLQSSFLRKSNLLSYTSRFGSTVTQHPTVARCVSDSPPLIGNGLDLLKAWGWAALLQGIATCVHHLAFTAEFREKIGHVYPLLEN